MKLVMKCKQCNKKMKGTKRKVFCSDRCRVYWNREKGTESEIGEDMVSGEVKEDKKPVAVLPGPLIGTVKEKFPEDEGMLGKHPKWREGDPKEGSIAFYMKYDVYSYDEMK